jgi:hypothetical protein
MKEYNDLKDENYHTGPVFSYETDQTAPSGDPLYCAPHHFLFKELGWDRTEQAELKIHAGEFRDGGYNGIPPEAVLLAMREYFKGMQLADMNCREYKTVAGLLDDCVQSLKGVNERRNYYGVYGTTLPDR